MMPFRISSETDFQSLIKKGGVALVDFNAPWCQPCREQEPIIQELAARFKDRLVVVEINVDENRETARNLEIQSIPTLIIFKDGNEIRRFVGRQPPERLTEAVVDLLD